MFPRRRARPRTCGMHLATSPREVDAATAGHPAKSRRTIAHTVTRKRRPRETGDAMIRPQMPATATRLKRSVPGPGRSLAAAAMERCPLLPQVVPGVSSSPCLCSSTASSQQKPTPAPDATTLRLTDATARSPKQSAWLSKVIGLTRADLVIPRPTSNIPIARGNTLGVALTRPVMLVSAPCPSEPATQRRASSGHMSAGPAATALLGAASYREMAQSPAATATSTRVRVPLTFLTQLGPTSASSAKRIPCRRMRRRLWTMGESGLPWPCPFPSQSL